MKMLNKQNSLKKVIRPNSNWFPHKSVLPMYYIIDMRTKQTRYLNLFCYQNKTALKLHDWFSNMEGWGFRKFVALPCEILLPMTPEASSIFGLCSISEMLTPHVFRLGCNVAFPQSHILIPSMHHYHNHNVNTCCYLISYIHDVSSFTKWILDPES